MASQALVARGPNRAPLSEGGGSLRDNGGSIPNRYRLAHDAHFLQMKTLFTAEAVSKGGRWGTVQTPDCLLNVTLGNPLEKGIEKRGPNPELLLRGLIPPVTTGQ